MRWNELKLRLRGLGLKLVFENKLELISEKLDKAFGGLRPGSMAKICLDLAFNRVAEQLDSSKSNPKPL